MRNNHFAKFMLNKHSAMLESLKNKLHEEIEKKKELIVANERITVYKYVGEKSGLTILDDKETGLRNLFIIDYYENSPEEMSNEDFFRHKKEDMADYMKRKNNSPEDLVFNSLAFSYFNEEIEVNNYFKLSEKIRAFATLPNLDEVWRKNFENKTTEESKELLKEYGLEKLGVVELFKEKESFDAVMRVYGKKRVDFNTAETAGIFADLLGFINEEMGGDFKLPKDAYSAMAKYAEDIKKTVESWRDTFPLMIEGLKNHNVTSKEIASNLKMNNEIWMEDNKLIISYNMNAAVVDFKDKDNYCIYFMDGDTHYLNDFLKLIKENKVDKNKNITLEVKNGKAINANPWGLHSFSTDMEFGFPNLKELGIVKREEMSYEETMRYYATLHGVSELNILWRAFICLGSGFECTKDGLLVANRTGVINETVDYKKVNGFEELVFMMPVRREQDIKYLSKEWHLGLKKLLNYYKEFKTEGFEEVARFSEKMNEGRENKGAGYFDFHGKQVKDLENRIKKLKLLDKAMNETHSYVEEKVVKRKKASKPENS